MSDTKTTRGWLIPIIGLLAITFTICTGELVISGLLPTLAADLKVDIPTAGLLITGYAVGVAVTGPLLSLVTGEVPRKTLLLAIIAVFIAGNVLCAVSPGYWVLLAARLMMSACHGLYFGVAMVIATQLAPPGRQASAVSLVVAGVSIAIVLGVPLGTAIGNAWGWRTTFWITAAAGAVAGLVVAWLIPTTIGATAGEKPDAGAQMRAAFRPIVLVCYATFGIALVGFFAMLSYAVPFLLNESGFGVGMIPLILLVMGIAAFLGTLLGGRLGDWNPGLTLIGAMAINVGLYVLLSQVATVGWPAVTLLCLIWLVGFTAAPIMQSWVIREASDAPNLASTLMNTASQVGIAGGAALGALLIASGWGYSQIPLFSAIFYAAGFVGALILAASDRRRKPALA